MVSTINLTRAISINKLPSVFAVIDAAHKSGWPILMSAIRVQRRMELTAAPMEPFKVRGVVEGARARRDERHLSD